MPGEAMYVAAVLQASLCIFLLGVCSGAGDQFRQLTFVKSLKDKALVDHVIRSVTVSKEDVCEVLCYLDEDCLSYNLGPLKEGTRICELCDLNHNQNLKYLVERKGFSHHPTKSDCSNTPCNPNSKCQAGFTEVGFRCVCLASYKGKDCLEGKIFASVTVSAAFPSNVSSEAKGNISADINSAVDIVTRPLSRTETSNSSTRPSAPIIASSTTPQSPFIPPEYTATVPLSPSSSPILLSASNENPFLETSLVQASSTLIQSASSSYASSSLAPSSPMNSQLASSLPLLPITSESYPSQMSSLLTISPSSVSLLSEYSISDKASSFRTSSTSASASSHSLQYSSFVSTENLSDTSGIASSFSQSLSSLSTASSIAASSSSSMLALTSSSQSEGEDGATLSPAEPTGPTQPTQPPKK